MSDTTSDTPGTTQETLVTGVRFTALSLYVMALTVGVAWWILREIPSCQPAGFVVTRISPLQVLTAGGERIRVVGEGFHQDAKVRVGPAVVQTTFLNAFELEATTPPLGAGRVVVTVEQPGFSTIHVPSGLEYVTATPVLKRFAPALVLTKGDEPLQIFGERFRPGASVRFGPKGKPVTARFVSPSELVVSTPRSPSGVVEVFVSQDTGSASLAGSLQFVAERPAPPATVPMQITAVEPSTSSTRGGEPVTITGTGFTPDMAVRFGGLPARSVRVDGSRFITAVTPMHPVGPVTVVVGNDQALSTMDGKFAFTCPTVPDKTMMLLVFLAAALGGLVHVLRSLYWYRGQQKLMTNWVPMYVLLPFAASALGFVFYLVIRAGIYEPTPGTSYLLVGLGALVGMFSIQATEKLKSIAEGIFTKAPTGADHAATRGLKVSAIAPTTGPTDGGTIVTIVGTGFTTGAIVRFDTAVSPQTACVNSSTLTAVAPARAAGTVDVAVKIGENEEVLPKAFTFMVPKGTITNVAPPNGPAGGGTTVTITGTGFAGPVAVTFGGKPGIAAKVLSPQQVEVITPAQAKGKVDVRIDSGSDLIAVAPMAFEYT